MATSPLSKTNRHALSRFKRRQQSKAGISPVTESAVAGKISSKLIVGETVNRLVIEHSQNGKNPLSSSATEAILESTQPVGTIAVIPEKSQGNQKGNVDLNYVYTNGEMLKAEIKTVINQQSFNSALEDAFNPSRRAVEGDGKGADIVAVQVPSGTTTSQAKQWIDAFWKSTSGKTLADSSFTFGSIAIVKPDGTKLVPLTPFVKP